jgi:uncharacterized protein
MAFGKRAVRIGLGGFFLIMGLVGFVLPILQGWLFIALAVIFLSRDIRFFANLESRMTSRFPKAARIAERLRRIFPLWDD